MQSKIQPGDILTIQKTFGAPQGEKALALLNRLFYNTISYTPGNSHETAFKEGHRDVVQFINNCVAFDGEQQQGQ